MKIRFLGTGTSTGVPQIGCDCPACTSSDLHDKRLRASVLIECDGHNIVIDVGPDFRRQMLDAGSPSLAAALITHTHYDHLGGVDDLRPYCAHNRRFPLYCEANVARDLEQRVPYCFSANPYRGVPAFEVNIIDGHPFNIGDTGITVVPLRVMHYKLPILGYRIGPLSYITDAKEIPDATFDLLQGTDTLVINALRPKEHMSHMNLPQALEAIDRIRPRRAFLTHFSHEMGPQRLLNLPRGIYPAYDGLELTV